MSFQNSGTISPMDIKKYGSVLIWNIKFQDPFSMGSVSNFFEVGGIMKHQPIFGILCYL